jgi:hypothetical protein
MIIRRARAKDIREDQTGNLLTIEAAYYKEDNDIGRLAEIADDLRRIAMVVDVEIRDNPTVVRENR